MKYTVLLDEFEEREIRPPELYEQYAALAIGEIGPLLGDPATWLACACPACGADDPVDAFLKQAFAFQLCRGCQTLFVSPRPPAGALAGFRERSVAERFWLERVVSATAVSRGRYVSGPRVEWIMDNAEALAGPRASYLHVGPGYDGIPEMLAERGIFGRVVAVSPPPADARAPDPQVRRLSPVSENVVRGLGRDFGLAAVLEVLEGQFAPGDLLGAIRETLRPRGRVLISTVNCEGFEIEMLGERARGVGLPSHLNLFSLAGISRLLARSGFRVVELSTPGRLDAKLVAEALRETPDLPLPPFIRKIVQHEEAEVHRHFQEFLQLARLSSHLRVVAEVV